MSTEGSKSSERRKSLFKLISDDIGTDAVNSGIFISLRHLGLVTFWRVSAEFNHDANIKQKKNNYKRENLSKIEVYRLFWVGYAIEAMDVTSARPG